jgi:glycosyltransferase involved in cell wall biosynthesis
MSVARPMLSVVMPAYNEAPNLTLLHPRLVAALAGEAIEWEWIVVDDHSDDDTTAVLADLAELEPRLHVLRLSRNFGSHAAIACGLDVARGDAAVVMAADLQDAPEDVVRLLQAWRTGAQVVWGTRSPGGEAGARRALSSRAYERLIRRIVGPDALPPTGADLVLLDRPVIDAVRSSAEARAHIFMLVAWLGFRQEQVECTKAPRVHGRSGWTTAKKIELTVDSVIAFTERPLRWIGALGLLTATLGLLYAVVVVVATAFGGQPEGWSSLMVVTLVLGGGQMLMLSVIGSYVWRALNEVRRRPRYVVEATSGDRATPVARGPA